jgi:hydroxymethylpyrimidine/phosphomethylpyrimidine kinase
MSNQVPVVLSIAGSDPSGGAGIQADLKTFTSIGVYGAAVITSLTVQNTQGVTGCFPVDPELVKRQIVSVLKDLHVTHIKIGMTGSVDVTNAIADTLNDYPGEIIYDPVRISSSGASLLTGNNSNASWKNLLSRATVLTPNRHELESIIDTQCATSEEAVHAAQELFNIFPRLRVLCLTGGHFPGKHEVTDFMLVKPSKADSNSGETSLTKINRSRIKTKNLHGTGCTFAAAIAAYHLLTHDDTKAFSKASAFMHHIIEASASAVIGQGEGPLLHHKWKNGM